MSHEIDAEFVNDWPTEATQCRNCTSFQNDQGESYCAEARAEVPQTAHCDFFQSKN